jgi:sterol 3beta-glucosyltransferase
VEALGVGTGVRKLTVENLAEALVSATTDQRQIARAKLVGEQIRSVGGLIQPQRFRQLNLLAGKWRSYSHRGHLSGLRILADAH